MKLLVHLVFLILAAVVILGGVIFVIIDMFTRVDYIKDKAPPLARLLEKRATIAALVLMASFLLIGDGYELFIKEVPEIPLPPTVVVKAPVPPTIQVRLVAAPNEPKDSLRRRTLRLADEVYDFLIERQQHHPPVAYPDSSDPNPSDERKRAIKLCQDYDQETWNQYMRRYRDPMIGIVREYESKGVPTRYLENDFKQRVPGAMAVGSDWEGSPMDELSQFRNLAYRVDAHDNAIHF